MATDNATKFLESIWKDEQLRSTVQAQPNLAAVMEIASDSGYEFTEDEFHQAQLAYTERHSSETELDEEALDAVAGGATACCCCCCPDINLN